MLDKFVEKGGKRLRYGYTTGSCATAAAAGAARMVLGQQAVAQVTIPTPKGWELDLELHDVRFDADSARCSVIKDAGDDPDVTQGVKVFVTLTKKTEPGIAFHAGDGVGTVTRPGLSVPPGEPAINPGPRETITRELMKVMKTYGFEGGFDVEVSIPGGKDLAARTFNPRLGIEGGLSVIGTSGIVEPMSEEALKASMRLELSMLAARGIREITFVPGNYGRDFALERGLDDDRMVKISNYTGYMFDQAERLGITSILFIGHLGKLVKVAGGLFNTHSAVCDGRMEILAAHAALLGAGQPCIQKIMAAGTTDEAVTAIMAENLPGYFDHLARTVKKRCEQRVYGNITVEVILFSKERGLLGATDGAAEMEGRLCTH